MSFDEIFVHTLLPVGKFIVMLKVAMCGLRCGLAGKIARFVDGGSLSVDRSRGSLSLVDECAQCFSSLLSPFWKHSTGRVALESDGSDSLDGKAS